MTKLQEEMLRTALKIIKSDMEVPMGFSRNFSAQRTALSKVLAYV